MVVAEVEWMRGFLALLVVPLLLAVSLGSPKEGLHAQPVVPSCMHVAWVGSKKTALVAPPF